MIDAYALTLVNGGGHIGPLHFETEQDAFDFTVQWAEVEYRPRFGEYEQSKIEWMSEDRPRPDCEGMK